MRICVLASGSKGNSTYIETANHKILIDIGKNKKYIVDKLAEIGVNADEIDYILISHLHTDHISALNSFIKKYHPTVCLSQQMFQELNGIHEYDSILIYENEIILSNLKIKAIKSSHDATDSRNFVIEEGNKSVVYVTDTGYVNSKYFNHLKNKNVYLFESNHDIEMLNHGPYPKWLKDRMISDIGHLSNKASSFYLTKLIGNNTKKIVLMHLSEKNNSEEKCLETINNTFDDYEIPFRDIVCARQDEVSEVINI